MLNNIYYILLVDSFKKCIESSTLNCYNDREKIKNGID